MSEESPTGAQYIVNLNAFTDAMHREFSDDTVVSHRCARCNATLDEASMEGHGERCFVVGDWVRWWPEGEVDARRYSDVCVADVLNGAPYTAVIDSHGPRWSSNDGLNGQRVVVTRGDVRRIPRPEQPTLSARLGHLKHGPGGSGLSGPCDADCKKCEAERCVRPSSCSHPHPWKSDGYGYKCQACDATGLTLPDATEPTLYDGLTAEQCLERFQRRQREESTSFGVTLLRPADVFTSAQLDAARSLWQQQLRARIDAAREQERVRVQIDADPDDTPW